MSFRFIAAWQGAHTVVRLCRTVGVTRADGALAVRIRAIFAASHVTYGVPRIHAELRQVLQAWRC